VHYLDESGHFHMTCLHTNGTQSLMLMFERLMIAEMCTSAPDTLLRADSTLNVQLPFVFASSKSA